MKILIATGIYPPEIGGPATYAKLLADELPKRAIVVDVLPFREVCIYPRLIRHIVYVFKIMVRARGCDLIFTQDPVSTGIPTVCAAFIVRKKVVMRVAGDYAWEQAQQRYGVIDTVDKFQNKRYSLGVEILRTLQRFAVRHADVVITPSEYFNSLVSGWNNGTKKITTIYNGIDLAQDFDRQAKYDRPTIVTAGRLVPWKGFDTLIRALHDMSGWDLLIAGDGPDRNRLEELARTLSLSERVTFLGNIPRSELFARIWRSHVFALLSTFESFSFQVVEAMFVGTPVIAARIGNLSEIIDDGIHGLLIDPSDITSFKAGAERIVADPTYASALSLVAGKRAAEFSVERTLDRLVGIFYDQIKTKQP